MSRWQMNPALENPGPAPYIAAAEERLNRWAKAWAAATFGIDAPPIRVGPTGHRVRSVKGYFDRGYHVRDLGDRVAVFGDLTALDTHVMVNQDIARGFVELPAAARAGLDRYLRDVVKHELVHAVVGDAGDDHGAPFARLANDIGRREGLDVVHAGSEDCHRVGRDHDREHWLTCACAWPHYSGDFERRYGDAFAWVELAHLL